MNYSFKNAVDLESIKKIKNSFKDTFYKTNLFGYFLENIVIETLFPFLMLLFLGTFIFNIDNLTQAFLFSSIPFSIIIALFFGMFHQTTMHKKLPFKVKGVLFKNCFLSSKNINKINSQYSSLSENEQSMLSVLLEKKSVLKENEPTLAYYLILNKLEKASLLEIRENKDIIFSFIQKFFENESKTQKKLVTLLENKLKEKTVDERLNIIDNELNKPKNEKIQTNINKSVTVKSL